MVFDENDCIVGMLVAGDASVGDIITPIAAILNYPGWKGRASLVRDKSPTEKTPPAIAPMTVADARATGGAATLAPSIADAACVPKLIEVGSSAEGLAQAWKTAAAALKNFPTNGCAAHLSALLHEAGINIPMTLGAGMLGHRLADRGWTRIECGRQKAGDVGVCFDNTDPPGADHIYLVVKTMGPDEMLIADNQRKTDEPHSRFASGKGKTPTEYFLRAV